MILTITLYIYKKIFLDNKYKSTNKSKYKSTNKSKYKSTNKSKYNEFSSANIIMMIDIFRMNKKQLDKVKQLWVHYLILIKQMYRFE
jgi:hypothetical protein